MNFLVGRFVLVGYVLGKRESQPLGTSFVEPCDVLASRLFFFLVIMGLLLRNW